MEIKLWSGLNSDVCSVSLFDMSVAWDTDWSGDFSEDDDVDFYVTLKDLLSSGI